MMCLLHCSYFTHGVGIGRCSCASCWWSECFHSLIASLDYKYIEHLTGEDRWCRGSSNLVASSFGQLQIIIFCVHSLPIILWHRHHLLRRLLLPQSSLNSPSSSAEHVPNFITLHTDLQSWRFLICWKEDLMELQNNLLFAHGTSLILDEKLITIVTLHRWWWSHDFLRGHASYLLLKQTILPKSISL